MCVLVSSTTFGWNVSHSKKKWARFDKKCILVFMQSTRYFCQILMKLKFSLHFLKKYSNIKFHENPSSGSRVVQCGQTDAWTDVTKLIFAFRSFVNWHKSSDRTSERKQSPLWKVISVVWGNIPCCLCERYEMYRCTLWQNSSLILEYVVCMVTTGLLSG